MRSIFSTGSALALALALQIGPAAAAQAEAAPSVTEQNRKLILDFADLFYRQKKVREAFETYVAPDYIQHNPGIGDGRDTAVAALVPMLATPQLNMVVRRVLVDGDLAAVHVQVSSPTPPDPRAIAIVDLFRIKDGRIVEHWDVVQPIPAKAANPHPGF